MSKRNVLEDSRISLYSVLHITTLVSNAFAHGTKNQFFEGADQGTYFGLNFCLKMGLTRTEILPTYSRGLLNVSSMAFSRETFLLLFRLGR